MPPVKELAKKVERLEADKVHAKVTALLAKAKRAGKIGEGQVASLRAQGMKDPKWLKGHLATLPKLMRGPGEEFVPRAGTEGDPAAPTNEAQQKIRSAATAGMTEKERAIFNEEREKAEKKSGGLRSVPRS